MKSEILVNVTTQETKVALLENNVVVEFFIERSTDRHISGSIYKGRVVRVLPGMQAAFVDIGLEKAAFLYVSDVYEDLEEYDLLPKETEGEEGEEEEEEEGRRERRGPSSFQIENLLKEGQEVLVQVTKEPLGAKGARITSRISLPGRYIVFMPFLDHVGVSRRIASDKERRRLKEIVQRVRPSGAGFIVRTAGEGRDENELRQDMEYLIKLWATLQRQRETAPAPCLIHRDLDLSLRTLRDLYTPDVERLVIDSKEDYDRLVEFIETFLPGQKVAIEPYDKEEGIFEHFGVGLELTRALQRKVWLKSGGYISIDQTEALTAVDVNTGRYVGKRRLEDTIVKTNLEAVKEIAYQLRLRNIGGIIVLDFIDMDKEGNRERVYQALLQALRNDKAKTNILKISDLGIIEMTRKRTRDSLLGSLCEPCFYCEGKGYIKSRRTVCYDIFRHLRMEAPHIEGGKIVVTAHPEVANMLYDEERFGVEELERKLNKRIIVKARANFHLEQFEISPDGTTRA